MTKFEKGDRVFWTDPEGFSSGYYNIVERKTYAGRDSIYLIANQFSEAEVYAYELRLIKDEDD